MTRADDFEARKGQLVRLLAPHHDRARSTARRLCRSSADGDDLFHEAVLRALDRVGELRDEARFRPWFYAVMLSVHRARARRAFWRGLLPLEAIGVEAAAPAAGHGAFEGADRMARALATLSAPAREAIVLFELEGFTLEEIAALQGESVGTVKSRLSRARERLRRHYGRLEAGPSNLLKENQP
ncbi:MAG TPA: RNA polymerase sigma factor [Polyangiaceae bacterium]|nr:RNA polymerase sigma factor [Polyangiaceae bacterium]